MHFFFGRPRTDHVIVVRSLTELEPIERATVEAIARTYRDTRIKLRDRRFISILIVIIVIGVGFGIYLKHGEDNFTSGINQSLNRDKHNCQQLSFAVKKFNDLDSAQIKAINGSSALTPEQKAARIKQLEGFKIPVPDCR